MMIFTGDVLFWLSGAAMGIGFATSPWGKKLFKS